MEFSNKINASPTKDFFISMLTRDIDVKAAILELIDNAIDGAKQVRNDGNYNGLYINLTINKEHFIIEDNCGGMSIDIAQNYAFRFGRPKDRPKIEGNFTGAFGIGMKRSLFRLGNYFSVESKTEIDSFKLCVDVKQWLEEDDNNWEFAFTEANRNQRNPNEIRGTKIVVTELHSGIQSNFDSPFFISQLKEHLSRYRTIVAENGLAITLNNKEIVFSKEKILISDNIKPYVKKKNIENVDIKILAGLAVKGEPEKAGWYIYCNGRIIISADQTELTGWGDKENEIKKYHPSLAAFRGFVFFESSNAEKLPWNTTKTGIDTSSNAYIQARVLMIEATKQVIRLINEIDKLEDMRETAEKYLFKEENLKILDSLTIEKLTTTESAFTFPEKLIPEKTIPMTSIQFSVEKPKIEKLKKYMNVSANYEVGKRLFDYYWENEICE